MLIAVITWEPGSVILAVFAMLSAAGNVRQWWLGKLRPTPLLKQGSNDEGPSLRSGVNETACPYRSSRPLF